MAKEELSPDLAMAGLLNDPEIDEDEIIKAIETGEEGIEEEDINSLEGEEGEEEATDEDELHDETGDDTFEPFDEDEH